MKSMRKYLLAITATLFLVVLCLHLVRVAGQQREEKSAGQNVSLADFSNDSYVIARETIAGRQEAANGFSWRYGYDVALHDALMIKVGVNLIPTQGVAAIELDRAKPAWEQGIERLWSNRFALETRSGRRYPILIDITFLGPVFHHDVIVRPGSGRTDALNWNLKDSPELVAHEFGHMIGLFDEYERGALAPENAIIDSDSIMSSNPGPSAVPRARHYEPFRKWFIGKTMMNNVRIVHEKASDE